MDLIVGQPIDNLVATDTDIDYLAAQLNIVVETMEDVARVTVRIFKRLVYYFSREAIRHVRMTFQAGLLFVLRLRGWP